MREAIDPRDLGPSGAYKLTSGLVVPRPIGWIGSRSADGTRNLAPFSFFNMVSGSPPTVIFSPGSPKGVPKDTLANVRETGVFTVNIVSGDLARAMNATSATVAPDVDEFQLVGVTPVDGDVVDAPMVAESPASMECRATNFVPVSDQPGASVVVFGEIVRYHVRPGVLEGTRVNLDVLDPVGRLSGPGYTRTRDRFDMIRPD
ncbi:MAG: flavin reductase family protein [Acidimicrobiia bacterium]